MVVNILFKGSKAGPIKSQLKATSKEQAFIAFFKLNKTIPYGSKAHYLISDKLMQEEYEQWFKNPSNFTKILSIK